MKDDSWVYGGILHYTNHHGFTVDKWFIYDNEGDNDEVQSSSLGQFTGLYDKNGKEIYEGDILKRIILSAWIIAFPEGITTYCEVKWSNNGWVCAEIDSKYPEEHKAFFAKHCEVIGNIYDNKELISKLIKR